MHSYTLVLNGTKPLALLILFCPGVRRKQNLYRIIISRDSWLSIIPLFLPSIMYQYFVLIFRKKPNDPQYWRQFTKFPWISICFPQNNLLKAIDSNLLSQMFWRIFFLQFRKYLNTNILKRIHLHRKYTLEKNFLKCFPLFESHSKVDSITPSSPRLRLIYS